MSRRIALLVVALAAALGALPPALAADKLVVCLDENIPLLSVRHGGNSSGFDLAVADAVAKRLGSVPANRCTWSSASPEPAPTR